MYLIEDFIFPKDFKFGIADADLQVMGEIYCLENENSEPSMWTDFAKNSGKVFNNDTPLDGTNRYNLWEKDVDLIKNLGTKNYRTSISMCRTMFRDKKPNFKAIDWYKRFFSSLQKQGIKIYATIYHWELPKYLSDNGGWTNRETIHYLVEHARIVQKYLGDYIEEYFILNEPFQSTFESYLTGAHAPGDQSLSKAIKSVHHILLAQGLICRILKSTQSDIKLSTAFNTGITYAASPSELDLKAAKWAFGYFTSIFTDPTFLGSYPDFLMDYIEPHLPKIEADDFSNIKIGHMLNSFGVNYYRARIVKYSENSPFLFEDVKYHQGITNGLGWPVSLPPTYPEALYDLLREIYARYKNHGMKNIYITENGTCIGSRLDSAGCVNDDFRVFYLREHIKQIQKAILAGIPINAYFLWTLLDNYEWEFGYSPESCFGIVYVDRNSFERIPKKSYNWYANLVTNRKIA
jgi:beta-glucosidase